MSITKDLTLEQLAESVAASAVMHFKKFMEEHPDIRERRDVCNIFRASTAGYVSAWASVVADEGLVSDEDIVKIAKGLEYTEAFQKASKILGMRMIRRTIVIDGVDHSY